MAEDMNGPRDWNVAVPALPQSARRRIEQAVESAINFRGQSAGPPKVHLEVSDVRRLLAIAASASTPPDPCAEAGYHVCGPAPQLTRERIAEIVQRMIEDRYELLGSYAAAQFAEDTASELLRVAGKGNGNGG